MTFHLFGGVYNWCLQCSHENLTRYTWYLERPLIGFVKYAVTWCMDALSAHLKRFLFSSYVTVQISEIAQAWQAAALLFHQAGPPPFPFPLYISSLGSCPLSMQFHSIFFLHAWAHMCVHGCWLLRELERWLSKCVRIPACIQYVHCLVKGGVALFATLPVKPVKPVLGDNDQLLFSHYEQWDT